MVDSGQNMPLRNTSTPSATNQQQDFYSWLRRMPFGFLQDLYSQYSLKKDTNTSGSEAYAEQLFPTVSVDKSPPADAKEIVVIRQSVFFLISTIIGIELFFDILYISLRFIPIIFSLPSNMQEIINPYFIIIFITVNILKIICMLITACEWVATRYELREGEIRFKYGMIFTNEKIYLCTYTQEVICSQSFLGRIFNYGTIEIFNPVIKEVIYIDSVPNPHKYVEIIKSTLPRQNERGLVPL